MNWIDRNSVVEAMRSSKNSPGQHEGETLSNYRSITSNRNNPLKQGEAGFWTVQIFRVSHPQQEKVSHEYRTLRSEG